MPLEAVTLEFLLLSDHAEVINGKLYMMGAGYDRRNIADINESVTLRAVVSVLVPWNLTNQTHSVKLRIETEDGVTLGQEVQGNLNVGRGVEAISGQMFRVMAVINFTLTLPRLGAYRVIATMESGESKSTTFYAVSSEASARQNR